MNVSQSEAQDFSSIHVLDDHKSNCIIFDENEPEFWGTYCISINFAPKTRVLFIHKHSHSSFRLKHFVTAALPMPLYMQINAIVRKQAINRHSCIKYSCMCSTTKCTHSSISARTAIHMYSGCLTSWQRWLLVLDGEKVHALCYMLHVSLSAGPFWHGTAFKPASESEMFPSGNLAHELN